ncbi:MAG: hypothetical protein ABIG10_00085 [bacterium]
MLQKNNKGIIILVIIIALLVVGVVMTNNRGAAKMTPDEAKTRAETFINDILMQGDSSATVDEIIKYKGGMYALKISLEGNDEPIDSYISEDGKLFFPQALDIAEMSGEEEDGETTDEPVAQAPKSDRPNIELFVMSHCPYGTQMEKGIIPVVNALYDSIDFELKFVDYAMHAKKELDEQMKEYCIQKEQRPKILPYLNCFLKDGDTERCLNETGIDKNKMNACVAKIDEEYKISEVFESHEGWDTYPPFNIYKDDNDKYGVGGSPTLVVNGEVVTSGRDSSSLAKLICGSFNEGKAPAACSNDFSSATPAPGFGEATTTGADDASCD